MKTILLCRSPKGGGGRRVCRQTGQHKIAHAQLAKLSQYFVDEFCPPLRMAQELAVVRSRGVEKAYVLFAGVCAQTRHCHQVIAVVAKKKQRLQRGLIGRLDG